MRYYKTTNNEMEDFSMLKTGDKRARTCPVCHRRLKYALVCKGKCTEYIRKRLGKFIKTYISIEKDFYK
jgi:hypothetical protein